MKEYTATVTIDKQNRVTIPKAIRAFEKLGPGDVVEIAIRTIEKGNANALLSA